MRNLKRALSLAMATFMLLGMMVVGAGAASLSDFTDADKIVNGEAVTVLSTLGVIQGREDNSYNPEGIVTRGEMAKMICFILNGGREPNLGATLNNTYTDTVGHWAAAYIEYCTTKGIVSGRGNGTFDPNGTVTVAEAGKMVLVSLGYNAGVEGYTGANWQINTDVRANTLKLYQDLGSMNTSVDLTRDNAAQMLYNALDDKMVEYSYIITGNVDNSISTKPQLNDTKRGTLLWEMFGAVKLVGAVTANEFANMNSTKVDTDLAPKTTVVGAALSAGKTEITVTNYDDGQTSFTNAPHTLTLTTGEEELGKAVYLYVKPGNTDLKAEVIGSAIISDENVIVTDTTGDSLKDVLDDNNMETTDKTRYAYNYSSLGTTEPAAKDGMKGIQRTIVDLDGNGDVDYVLYKEMRLGKVTLHSDAKDGQVVVGVDTGSYINDNKKNIVGFDAVAKDDYVLTAYFGGKLHMQKAETLTGTIEAYKQTGDTAPYRNTNFTVEGENYDVSRVLSFNGDVTRAVDEVDKTILGSDATFYLDENGFVVAYGEVDESAYKYAYIWGAEAGSKISTDRVKATLEDGTTKTYDVSTNGDVDVIADKPDGTADMAGEKRITSSTKAQISETTIGGMVFAYTLTSGGDIKLYVAKGGAVSGKAPEFTKGLTTVKVGTNAGFDTLASAADVKNPVTGGSYYSYGNNATTFFYVTTDSHGKTEKVSVYNGRNSAPSIDASVDSHAAAGITLSMNKRGDVGSAVFVNVKASESAGDHMFIYSAKYVSEEFVTVDAFLNGATEATKDIKASLRNDGEVEHNPEINKKIYLYTKDGKGNYELTDPTNQAYYFTGNVIRVNKANNTFVISTTTSKSEEFQIGKESVVIDYDSNHSSPVAIANGSVSIGDEVQIIVTNATDRSVMMAVITDRGEINNGGGGVTMNWDGKQPSGTTRVYPAGVDDVKEISKLFREGKDVFIGDNFSPDTALVIPKGRALYVAGDMGTNGSAITNNGSLFIAGDMKGFRNQSATADSYLEIHKDWDGLNPVTINGTARVGGVLENRNGKVTVEKDGKLYTGAIDVSGGTLTVKGHAESDGSAAIDGNPSVKADTIIVSSPNTLKVTGEVVATTLTIGTADTDAKLGETGKVDAGKLTIANSITVLKGSLLATSITTGSVDVKAAGAVTVSGTVNAVVNVTSGSFKADSLKGNLTITGTNPIVTVPTVEGNVTNTSTGSNVSTGTSPSTNVVLSGNITVSATYGGKVTIEGGTNLAAGVVLTLNGDVTDFHYLGYLGTGTDTAKAADNKTQVIFGAKATVDETNYRFVNQDPDKKTYIVGPDKNGDTNNATNNGTLALFANSTFTFVPNAESPGLSFFLASARSNAAYKAPVAPATAMADSQNIYA